MTAITSFLSQSTSEGNEWDSRIGLQKLYVRRYTHCCKISWYFPPHCVSRTCYGPSCSEITEHVKGICITVPSQGFLDLSCLSPFRTILRVRICMNHYPILCSGIYSIYETLTVRTQQTTNYHVPYAYNCYHIQDCFRNLNI